MSDEEVRHVAQLWLGMTVQGDSLAAIMANLLILKGHADLVEKTLSEREAS